MQATTGKLLTLILSWNSFWGRLIEQGRLIGTIRNIVFTNFTSPFVNYFLFQSVAKRPCFVPSPLQTDTNPHSKIELPIHHENNHSAALSPIDSQAPCQKRAASPYEDDNMPSLCKQEKLSLPVDNDMCVATNGSVELSRNWQHPQECDKVCNSEQYNVWEYKRLHEEEVARRAQRLESQLHFLQVGYHLTLVYGCRASRDNTCKTNKSCNPRFVWRDCNCKQSLTCFICFLTNTSIKVTWVNFDDHSNVTVNTASVQAIIRLRKLHALITLCSFH